LFIFPPDADFVWGFYFCAQREDGDDKMRIEDICGIIGIFVILIPFIIFLIWLLLLKY
jgi:hypothetical protein